MEAINQRMKSLRKDLKMSQDAFGAQIGIKGSSVSYYESGKNAVTEQNILAVCRVFSASEDWLRHGTGEMYKYEDRETSRLAEEFNLDEYGMRIISAYQKMPPQDREALIRFMRNVFEVDNINEEGRLIVENIENQGDDSSSGIG